MLRVVVLVTVTDPQWKRTCTLFFETIRTGFPTALIEVYDNANEEDIVPLITEGCSKTHAQYYRIHSKVHHASWIRWMIEEGEGPLVIVDPDTVFWENMEGEDFPNLLAGYFVPMIWNEFAGCVSVPRLHTSLLYVKDCQGVKEAIRKVYPYAFSDTGLYSPLNLYHPETKFFQGCPLFWDSCAGLYHCIGGAAFGEDTIKKYEHVNSSSFMDVMYERMQDREVFLKFHQVAEYHPVEKLRNLSVHIAHYYNFMHEKAKQFLSKNGVLLPPHRPFYSGGDTTLSAVKEQSLCHTK